MMLNDKELTDDILSNCIIMDILTNRFNWACVEELIAYDALSTIFSLQVLSEPGVYPAILKGYAGCSFLRWLFIIEAIKKEYLALEQVEWDRLEQSVMDSTRIHEIVEYVNKKLGKCEFETLN